MFGTKHRKRPIQDEFCERLGKYISYLRRYEIPFEVNCCHRFAATCLWNSTPMGESAHGYMLIPLRGDVNWNREVQRHKVNGAKSDSYFPHDA